MALPPVSEWNDVSDEEWREYVFPEGHTVRVTGPRRLLVKRSRLSHGLGSPDSHRLVDAEGVSHYIPYGWLAIRWKGLGGPAYSF